MAAGSPAKTGGRRPWSLLAGILLLGMIGLAVESIAGGRAAPVTCTGTGCTRPPTGPALGAPHRYTSQSFGYSIDYYDRPDLGDRLQVKGDDRSLEFLILGRGGSYPVRFTGERAGGRTAEQIIDQVQQASFPDATPLYSPPGLTMGVTPGAARIYAASVTPPGGQAVSLRIAISAAVKNGLAVEMIAVGPYVRSTKADGHPNPSNTPITQFADEPLKGIRWPGDPPL